MAVVPVRPLAERRVAADFLDAGAVSMADAIAYAPTRPSSRRAFERLKGADVLRTDGQGKWWLDEERWNGRRSDRRTRVVLTMLAVAAAGAFAALR
ncbi:hypothetical protein [Porphyrobacter sp. CACIAM 03H1]|uniref:hypothetical protein n=1 Tax=Porphyrobacter sp. CACIAM 03H1 TaxID=2003315 RepID=UPI000B5AB732|nr:hypothetical protein [Porphyrobacter sp. CACIAM 03H1]ASJ91248.1 hypothetical protein CBR61_10205 [Porphyrobacter sp. CACIAM 03H1]